MEIGGGGGEAAAAVISLHRYFLLIRHYTLQSDTEQRMEKSACDLLPLNKP